MASVPSPSPPTLENNRPNDFDEKKRLFLASLTVANNPPHLDGGRYSPDLAPFNQLYSLAININDPFSASIAQQYYPDWEQAHFRELVIGIATEILLHPREYPFENDERIDLQEVIENLSPNTAPQTS